MFFFFSAILPSTISVFFFFNDTATTEIYTLSLHDALPIFAPSAFPRRSSSKRSGHAARVQTGLDVLEAEKFAPLRGKQDRKSTRLNSSHGYISYAVFCLKKKKNMNTTNLVTH